MAGAPVLLALPAPPALPALPAPPTTTGARVSARAGAATAVVPVPLPLLMPGVAVPGPAPTPGLVLVGVLATTITIMPCTVARFSMMIASTRTSTSTLLLSVEAGAANNWVTGIWVFQLSFEGTLCLILLWYIYKWDFFF